MYIYIYMYARTYFQKFNFSGGNYKLPVILHQTYFWKFHLSGKLQAPHDPASNISSEIQLVGEIPSSPRSCIEHIFRNSSFPGNSKLPMILHRTYFQKFNFSGQFQAPHDPASNIFSEIQLVGEIPSSP